MRIGRYRITRRGYLVFGIIGIILIVCLGMGVRNLWVDQAQTKQSLSASENGSGNGESSESEVNQTQNGNEAGNQTTGQEQTVGDDSTTNTSDDGASSSGLSLEEKNKILSENVLIIYFKPDVYDLNADYYGHLDEIVNMANRFKDAHIMIEGHYNGVPNLKANAFRTELAENRAEVVEAYLVSQGVEPDRIETMNMGASKPVNQDESWQEIEKNRRVVIYFKELK